MEAKKSNSEEAVKNEDVLKDKYAEFRLAAAQVKQLQEQLEAVEEKRQELEEASESLSQLKTAKKGAKTLVPVTSGIFATAALDNAAEVLVNVGSNVCVKKKVDDAAGMLKAKMHELMGFQERMLEELNRLTDQADSLEKELGHMLQEEGKG